MSTKTDITKYLAIILLCICGNAPAVLIPANQLADWTPGTNVGVPGGIPTDRTTIIDATQPPYNADKTGATDASGAINSAIAAAGSGVIVFLPAGTYRCDNSVGGGYKDNYTLRGAGMASTILSMRNASRLSIGGDGNYQWNYPNALITGSPSKGATTLAVDTSGFGVLTGGGVGAIAEIHLDITNTLPEVDVNKFSPLRKQKIKIVSVGSGTITFTPALLFDLPASRNPRIAVNDMATQAINVGVEDLKVDNTNTSAIMGIVFEQCYGCWIKNVEVYNVIDFHIEIFSSVHCEIRHSKTNARTSSGPNGAGILFGAASSNLTEDNIIQDNFPLVEVNGGSSGNVFAFNFLYGSDSFGVIGAGMDSNHGAHNCFNLYEGNVGGMFEADGFFGSVSEDTVFRNWWHGYSPTATLPGTTCVNLKRFTRKYSIVGNILGNSFMTWYRYDNEQGGQGGQNWIYAYGLPNIGNGGFSGYASLLGINGAAPWAAWASYLTASNGGGPGPGGWPELDLDVEATLIKKGNYNYFDNAIPASESTGGDTVPVSLFRSSKPAYFGSLPWPPIDPTSPGTPTASQIYQKIPAGYRFVNGVDPGGSDTTPPTVNGTPSIDTTGQILTVAFSEPVQNGAGGSAGWTINASGGAATVSFTSGTGSSTYLLAISRSIAQGETVTIGYTQPGNGVVDLAVTPNALATFTGRATTNGSTQGSVVPPFITLPAGPYFGPQSTTITESTPGAAIHYTTNGSTPTIASPTYSTAIPIASNLTIRAIATKTGFPDSTIATSAYEVVSWVITPAATKTFAIPAVTASVPWTFTVTQSSAPANMVISLGPGPISVVNDWSIAINLTASGAIQAKNGPAFGATQVVNYTTSPVVIRVDINYAAKTFSATANNVVFATNYAFATSQPSPVSLNYVGLFAATANATISNMTFQAGSSSGRYIGLRNVTSSP